MNTEKTLVSESTLSADYLRQFLHETYKLDETTTSCKLFRTGINHLYFVNTGNSKFVFRVYTMNWRTKLEILEEVRLLNHLKQNHVPVAYPIPDHYQNFIQELNAPEGLRFGVLFSFAKGEKRRDFTEQTSFNIGRAMAKMHKVTDHFHLQRVIYSAQTLLTDSFNISQSFFGSSSDEMIFIDKTTQYLINEYKKVNSNEIRSGVIHLDIWFDNMHISSEDEVTIFDFDFCGNGWLCHDIAYFILQLYNTRQSDETYENKVKSFTRGYESILKISDEEKRIIPMIAVSIWFFYLGVQCDRFDNWSNIFLGDEHLKRFTLAIKKWIDYNDLPIGQ
jgi:Ser/Thr protein kinase RdoA (MazF antagonist)